jgi:hypothetical protein
VYQTLVLAHPNKTRLPPNHRLLPDQRQLKEARTIAASSNERSHANIQRDGTWP